MPREGQRIYYVCPEDGDEEEHPNVFVLPGPSGLEIKLGDVKHFFPLKGQFHFRFLRRVGGRKVWIDIGEERQSVPRFDGGDIIVKASRLDIGNSEQEGGIKGFLAATINPEDETQPVGKLKSMFSKACQNVFQREDEELTPNPASPVRYSDSRPPQDQRQQRQPRPEAVSAPSTTARRPKHMTAPVSQRFAQRATPKSASNLAAAAQAEASQQQQTRSTKSASPPRSVPAPQPAPPPVAPPPPPSDLLNLDHSPQAAQSTTKPDDWHAFVGLDSAAPSPQQQQQQQPMRSAPMMHDPFAMAHHPQAQPGLKKPPTSSSNDFDAFSAF